MCVIQVEFWKLRFASGEVSQFDLLVYPWGLIAAEAMANWVIDTT